jgi:hypothetical protein
MRGYDFNDPKIVERWCGEQRAYIENYLRQHEVPHGPIAASAAWHAAPYLSVWSVESDKPGKIAWWVICGDVPADHVSAKFVNNPREALRTFAARWRRMASAIRGREDIPELAAIPRSDRPQLGKLLADHADLLDRAADNEAPGAD